MGPDTRADHARHGPRDFSEGAEGREDRGGVLQTGLELQRRLGDERERALGADDQLGEVVAASTFLTILPPVRMTSPQASTASTPEHVVAGDAVFHRAHPAGVGVHVAAEAGRVLAGKHRVHQAVGGQLRIELRRGGTPGSTTATEFSVSISRTAFMRSKLTHARHPVEGTAAPDSPVPAPRAVTATPRSSHGQDGGHLVGGCGPHHDIGYRPFHGQALVVGVVLADGRAGQRVIGSDHAGESVDQVSAHGRGPRWRGGQLSRSTTSGRRSSRAEALGPMSARMLGGQSSKRASSSSAWSASSGRHTNRSGR